MWCLHWRYDRDDAASALSPVESPVDPPQSEAEAAAPGVRERSTGPPLHDHVGRSTVTAVTAVVAVARVHCALLRHQKARSGQQQDGTTADRHSPIQPLT
eukprot:GHVU01007452.1.p2 GENE.GHVU01007452.1~~GHVU01007452.1.p2  ORF type:complete len:100 (-),score=8.20 GHVU01007452.1:261-560(-)